ncbi:hypothetical protein GCM10010156_16970 [Planobispora rosea]|uniref:Uncharacterized protein n=1 Tax=Planobispora rosea TaxID=35762 RepID=A0A8J3WC94_PLARO|nr:hypothetical protein GCM10010156_16970 [Planobispora rosea]GIH84694.1 hypothetical protein Pro02_31020 [Planobispora rosea]
MPTVTAATAVTVSSVIFIHPPNRRSSPNSAASPGQVAVAASRAAESLRRLEPLEPAEPAGLAGLGESVRIAIVADSSGRSRRPTGSSRESGPGANSGP